MELSLIVLRGSIIVATTLVGGLLGPLTGVMLIAAPGALIGFGGGIVVARKFD